MSNVIELKLEDFENLKKTNDIYLIDFWATWCGPCKIMGPIMDDLSLDIDLEDKIKFAKVNVDQQPELQVMFDVTSIPTFFLIKFSGDGNFEIQKNKLETFVGAQPAFQFKLNLQKALEKLNQTQN
jgi:thioredoxin 1